jgi:pimeloyl-ACP methyl ester carboxylesterase
MKKNLLLAFLLFSAGSFAQTQFSITAPNQQGLLDGRLLVMLSTNATREPRFDVTDALNTQLVFGIDAENWNGAQAKIVNNANGFGYPKRYMKEVPAGEYYVQVLLHKYETFHRKDGHTVKMPMDRGEGQQWNRAPGNLYSKPVKIKFDPKGTSVVKLSLDQVIPPIEEPKDTKYIKHIKIQSKLLTEFWGRPMYLGAHVLLPEGFDEHPDVKYPLAIFHGHFPDDFDGFRTTPPDPNLKTDDYNARFKLYGYNKIVQQEAYDFYKMWTGKDFPRVLAIEIQHACPFYDDSYAVNSENIGPYGDAITYELIPEIEKRFRGIGEGWARFTYGGSTGGWEALAVQVKYPDQYNGCYAACPDPIDFRAFTTVNIYEDKNAYWYESQFKKLAKPGHRDYLGQVSATVQEMNMRELALGTKTRSGQQFDIWEAVYSPVGKDGYPKRIWDKETGVIDKEVANYWKENYDLAYILKRDWAKNGEKWKGRIHIYCGDMDNYYLNNAVYLTEEMLKGLSNPSYDGEVDYGDRAEHCWNGDHTQPNAISRLRYHRMFVPKWAEEVKKTAPKGADLKSWRY